MERKLHTVGIHTAEASIPAGSENAMQKLKARYPLTCAVILYRLQTAIEGVEQEISGSPSVLPV
ncbi:MAG: TfoX/Sxy family protein [Zoogloeaceae bacterium]|nr:TfoX/Sxy family protein [Zoogloeaceae bacterium]